MQGARLKDITESVHNELLTRALVLHLEELNEEEMLLFHLFKVAEVTIPIIPR